MEKNLSRFKLIENITKNDNIFERLDSSKDNVIDITVNIKNICNFASAHQSKIRILKKLYKKLSVINYVINYYINDYL